MRHSSLVVFMHSAFPSICHRTYFQTSKGHVTWIIKKANRIPTHCGVAYESFRSLARGHVIRVCVCISILLVQVFAAQTPRVWWSVHEDTHLCGFLSVLSMPSKVGTYDSFENWKYPLFLGDFLNFWLLFMVKRGISRPLFMVKQWDIRPWKDPFLFMVKQGD